MASVVFSAAKKWVIEHGENFINSHEWNIAPEIMLESVESLTTNLEVLRLLEELRETHGEEGATNLLISAITYGNAHEWPQAPTAPRITADEAWKWCEAPANFPLIEKWMATGIPQEGIPIECYEYLDLIELSKSNTTFGKLIRAVQGDMNARNAKAFKEKYGYDLPED